jgi:hypothetical protein
VRGACGISDDDICSGRSGGANRMRFWGRHSLNFFAGLLGDIALGRLRAARRSVLRVLRLSCLLFLCLPRIPCFFFVHLYFSPRVDPLHDICRVEHPDGKKGTHGSGLPQRDVDYLSAALLQLDAFVNLAVEERVSGPPQKARLSWYVLCIVVVALEWRGAARECM